MSAQSFEITKLRSRLAPTQLRVDITYSQLSTMSNQQPVAQLESLKYRTTQIMESIVALQFLIEANGQPVMPSWPDILARYNLLLSQTHSLSVSLSSALANHQPSQPSQPQLGAAVVPPQNPFQKLALHPSMPFPEQQLDNALAPLLRNQPTIQVLKKEDASVRRIAAILKSGSAEGSASGHEQILRECGEITKGHDARVERAVKAVSILRDRYDWRARVEPEDADREDEGGGDEDREDEGQDKDAEEDVKMTEAKVEGVTEGNTHTHTSIASTPASVRSEEANEVREADDVLGQGTVTPGVG